MLNAINPEKANEREPQEKKQNTVLNKDLEIEETKVEQKAEPKIEKA